ncbi:hypothetical protein Taro_021646, partial [Colocasia esculenta]|nr:hypothetical protein [Colocasia esculenta]
WLAFQQGPSSASLLGLRRCFVCRVAPLVKHCDPYLWLLCIAWLFCSGGVSQNCLYCLVGCRFVALKVEDCSWLVSSGCGATSGLRDAAVVLAVAFWWVSQNGALVVLVEVLPEPVCVASTVCCVLSVGHLFGLCFGDVFPEWLLALSVDVLPKMLCFPATLVVLRVSLGSGDVTPLWCCVARVVDLDPVCGPLFGQFAVLFTSKFLGCVGGTTFPFMVSRVCSALEALRFPLLGHLVLAYALWLYRYRCGVAALPYLGCHGIQVGRVLVVVWGAIVLRLVTRRPAPSRSSGRRLKALVGTPSFPFSSFSLPSSSLRLEASFPFFSGSVELGGAAAARAEC